MHPYLKVPPPGSSGGKKTFKFQKPKPVPTTKISAPFPEFLSPIRYIPSPQAPAPQRNKFLPQSEPPPTLDNLFDSEGFDDDADFLSDSDLEKILEFERSVQNSCQSSSKEKPPKTLLPFPYEFPPPPGSVAGDPSWKEYCENIASKVSSGVLGVAFSSTPINALNVCTLKTLVSTISNPVHLITLACKIILPCLLQQNETGDVIHHEGFYKDIIHILEKVMSRLEETLSLHSHPTTICETSDLQELIQSIFEAYSNRKLDLEKTTIPLVLLRLHPPYLQELISSAVKTNDVTLLLLLCSSSPSPSESNVLMKILNILTSDSPNPEENNPPVTNDLDVDPDFITPPKVKTTSETPSKYKYICTTLLNTLRTQLDCITFINLLPRPFQPIYSIELELARTSNEAEYVKMKSYFRNEAIAHEVFHLLNEVFQEDKEPLAELLISTILPLTHDLLKDRNFTWTNVKYRLYPNLWHYLRRKLWLIS